MLRGCLREACRLAGRAPEQGGLYPFFVTKLSHEYAKPSAFAMPISCYRSMAAMTLEGLDDEPHQERRSGAHASSLAFAFVLGIIAGQALPCGKLSFDGHDFSSSRAESVPLPGYPVDPAASSQRVRRRV